MNSTGRICSTKLAFFPVLKQRFHSSLLKQYNLAFYSFSYYLDTRCYLGININLFHNWLCLSKHNFTYAGDSTKLFCEAIIYLCVYCQLWYSSFLSFISWNNQTILSKNHVLPKMAKERPNIITQNSY